MAKTAEGVTESAENLTSQPVDKEKVLPLPEWLKKVYYVFPIVLYIPDVIFNYYVYSDGWKPDPNPVLNIMKSVLVAFLSIGIVGMAYLLSVLAPWHWGQGHKMQAIASGAGVVIATAITTWNSLSYRSADFATFHTDEWIWNLFPDLKTMGISITMVLVSIAPPFWGLFWAVVQPTQSGRTLAQLNESHQERLLRLQQEAELKRLRAEANAKIREAQLRGIAATAAAAREQAAGVIGGRKKTDAPAEGAEAATDNQNTAASEPEAASKPPSNDDANGTSGTTGANDANDAHKVLNYPALQAGRGRELAGGQGVSMMNSVAAASPTARVAPAGASLPFATQSALISDADEAPAGDVAPFVRRPPTLDPDVEAMTGTTGPRQAVRRPFEPSPLMRGMNELPAASMQAVADAMRELNPTGKRRVSAAELTARVAEKLNIDEARAKQVITRYREAQRAGRS